MATSIQNIETPKHARALDTSGNNNHGQIYSGKALEFDGVTDYLTTGWGNGDISTPLTIACWVYVNTAGDHIFFGHGTTGTNKRIYIGTKSGVFDMGIQDSRWGVTTNEVTGFSDQPTCNLNTWYRVVVVLDGSTASMYINGIKSYAKTHTTFTPDTNFFIGDMDDDGTYLWDGMLSDLQLYDAAWTQDDVTYDYLNPESIVLNRSSTSLTESNLKMWYPMQDGHRGNQSYVLDASNTGLQDYFSDDFSTDTKDDYNSDNSAPITYDPGSKSIRHTYTRESGVGLKRDSLMVNYGTYKATFKARGTRTHNFTSIGKIGVAGAIKNPTLTSEFQDFEFIFQQDDQSSFRMYQGTGSIDDYLEIKDLVIQSINDKKNATTVFHGDNLLAGVSGAADGDWEDSGNTPTFSVIYHGGSGSGLDYEDDNTSSPLTGSKDAKVTNNTSPAEDAGIISNAITLVTGRRYRLKYNYLTNYNVSSQTEVLYVKIGETSATNSTNIDTAGGYAQASLQATSKTAVSLEFTHTDSDTEVFLVFFGGNGLVFQIDDLSLVEVGIASGWTDADQQLHIPQTALQSYNELAWCAGGNETVTINALAADLGTNNFVISYVLHPEDVSGDNRFLSFEETSNSGRVVHQIDDGVLEIYIEEDGGSSSTFAAASAAGALVNGNTYHIVESFDRTSNLVTTYINGEATGVTIDISGISGDDINCDGRLSIYQHQTTSDMSIQGFITELALWKNTTFNATTVNELYNDGKPLDALTHSQSSTLYGYWRNNGLSTWVNLASPGTKDSTANTMTETLLIAEGVDGSRDSQGFIMNRQTNTSSLNLIKRPYDVSGQKGGMYTEINDSDTLDFGVGAFTMEVWAKYKYTNTGSIYNVILSLGGNIASTDIGTGIASKDGSFVGRIYDAEIGSTSTDHSATLVEGNWYHLAVTLATDNTATFYFNGNAGGTATVTGNVTNAHAKRIGMDSNLSRHYSEQIDSVRIYSDALSGPEILRNYNATKSSHTN